MLAEAGSIFTDGPAASALVVPLVARDQLIGVMELYAHRRKLDPDDLVLAEDTSRAPRWRLIMRGCMSLSLSDCAHVMT